MRTETVQCDGWNHFKQEILERLFPTNQFVRGDFLFRGQRSSDWPLESSFDRWFKNLALSESLRVSFAEDLLKEFEHHGSGLHFQNHADSREKTLALAQHYGLPTRLLDWTESPYTAAFFAFADALEKPGQDYSVAIHALDTRSYVWKGYGVRLIRIPPDGNLRLRNQDGRFTLLESPVTTLEEYVAQMRAEGPAPLVKFEVPAAEAAKALAELDVMGANADRLFPDLQGCCQSAKISLLLNNGVRRASA